MGVLLITEVSAGGSVPELLAKNEAGIPVLLLDGEELTGAKQNRVLNTTILLREKSETVIPVSCTEHGRWNYRTDRFHDSDVIMAQKARANKARTVTDSLRHLRVYRSDQGKVWDDIALMSRSAGVRSETGAMRDVYRSNEESLEDFAAAFPPMEGQKGLLVFTGGAVAGFDAVSLASAYSDLHVKLVKSYAVDALIEGGEAPKRVDYARSARRFFEEIMTCNEEKYRSTGSGMDYRFEGGAAVGSALVTWERVIHMAFFKAGRARRSDRGLEPEVPHGWKQDP